MPVWPGDWCNGCSAHRAQGCREDYWRLVVKRQGVPVIGKVAIRYVEWGKLTQFEFRLNGTPYYTFRWEGEVLKADSESDLI